VLDELSVLADPLYFWLNLVGFLGLVGFLAWTALGRHQSQNQEQDPGVAVQEKRLAA
jgi:hypothetical protein